MTTSQQTTEPTQKEERPSFLKGFTLCEQPEIDEITKINQDVSAFYNINFTQLCSWIIPSFDQHIKQIFLSTFCTQSSSKQWSESFKPISDLFGNQFIVFYANKLVIFTLKMMKYVDDDEISDTDCIDEHGPVLREDQLAKLVDQKLLQFARDVYVSCSPRDTCQSVCGSSSQFVNKMQNCSKWIFMYCWAYLSQIRHVEFNHRITDENCDKLIPPIFEYKIYKETDGEMNTDFSKYITIRDKITPIVFEKFIEFMCQKVNELVLEKCKKK